MNAAGFGMTCVTAGNDELAGIITDGDLRRHMANGLLSRPASEVMTQQPKTIGPDALASEALGRMTASKITSLFVADDDVPVGILHLHDCLRAGVDVDLPGEE